MKRIEELETEVKQLKKEILKTSTLYVDLNKEKKDLEQKVRSLENPPKWKIFPKKSGFPGITFDWKGLLKRIWIYILIFAIGVVSCAIVF